MSNDLESEVRRVLRATTAGVSGRPDEASVTKRVAARRRRRRLVAVGSGTAATVCVVVGLVIIAGRDDATPILPAASPTTSPAIADASVPSTTRAPSTCEPSLTVPFIPANPPAGWTIGPLSPEVHVAAWSVPNGMIEVWNGIRDDLPVPDHVDRIITVLGQRAGIGPISDGYSVVVDLGPSRCERWAIVAHPGVTEADLQTVAEGLTLLPTG